MKIRGNYENLCTHTFTQKQTKIKQKLNIITFGVLDKNSLEIGLDCGVTDLKFEPDSNPASFVFFGET